MQFKIFDAPTSVNLILGNVWIALVSELWRHKNKCIFNGELVVHFEIFSLAQLNVWSWISSKVSLVGLFFSDWCLELLV